MNQKLPPVRGLRAPNSVGVRRRQPVANVVPDSDEWQEEQDAKQIAHGAAVKRQLEAEKAEKKRKEMLLLRGMPQAPDETAAMVSARMHPNEIPTKGNT